MQSVYTERDEFTTALLDTPLSFNEMVVKPHHKAERAAFVVQVNKQSNARDSGLTNGDPRKNNVPEPYEKNPKIQFISVTLFMNVIILFCFRRLILVLNPRYIGIRHYRHGFLSLDFFV